MGEFSLISRSWQLFATLGYATVLAWGSGEIVADESPNGNAPIAYNGYYSNHGSVSQPGMGDDSSALYNSYLRRNQPNEAYRIDEGYQNYRSENYNNQNYGYPQTYYYNPNPYFIVPPNTDPESQPGMGDDSSTLYQSYLRAHHQGY